MNLTEYVAASGNKVNGKTLRKPDLNLLAKLDAMGVVAGYSIGRQIVVNPHNGYAEAVNPLIARLIEWTYDVYSTYGSHGTMNYNGTKVAIGTYDRVRMLVLSLDNVAYSNFLD